MTLKDKAKYKWLSILSHFVDEDLLDGNHHPCPACGGVDRFRFDDVNGNGSYFCNGCGAGTGLHLIALVKKVSHSEAWQLVESVIDECTEAKPKKLVDRAARIQRVLDTCDKIVVGGDVHRYLLARGITPSAGFPLALQQGTVGGCSVMVGKLSKGRALVGLHITFVKDGKQFVAEGEDSAKKMFGFEKGGLNGAAIRLHAVGKGTRIVVAEGIETALSAHKKLGLPAWATGTAGLMAVLEVPPQITEVVIAGDNDFSYTGQAAAFALAKRLVVAKKKVTVLLPDEMGTDFNDELLDKRSAV